MKKTTLVLFAISLAAGWALTTINAPVAAAEDSGPLAITVHANKSAGKMPYIFRNGNAVNVKPLGYPLNKFFADQKPGSFYVANWNFNHYLEQKKSIQNLKQYLDDQTTGWNNNIGWMKKISDQGGEIILILGTSYWYGPKDAGFPPKDLDQWERFVQETVHLFDNEMKLNVRYQVWDEPDTHFFRGTLDQYFEVVRRAVIGMKKANPRAKFGGPSSSEFYGAGFKASKTEKPLIYNFIKYCSRTPLPSVGLPRIPVDFIGWHVFDVEPYTTVLMDQASQVRVWLKEFGYDEKTELNISSWTRWSGLTEAEFNGPFLGSYMLPMVCAMDRAGISRQVYFNVFDHWLEESNRNPDREFFEGGYGLFSKHFIAKASYNALQAMSSVEGERLQVEESDPFLTSIAASDGNKVSILISNYLPKDMTQYLLDNAPSLAPVKQYNTHVQDLLRTTGKSEKECADEVLGSVRDPMQKKRIQLAINVRQRIAGKGPNELPATFEDLRGEVSDQTLKDDFDGILKLRMAVQKRKAAPVNVKVTVKGLSTAAGWVSEHYIIDASHSNAYAVKDRIEDIASRLRITKDADAVSRAVRDINNWPEVKLNSAENIGIDAAGNLDKPLKVEPYSMHLLVLKKR